MHSVNVVSKPASRGLSVRVQHVYLVTKPTSRGLSARCAACLCGFWTYLKGTVRRGCSLFIRFLNLPPGDYPPGMQSVYAVSEPKSRGLLDRGAVCLCSFWTFLQGTVGQGCSLFMQFLNLPPGDCRPGVQSVYAVSKPASRGLSTRGAACLCGFLTYLQGTVHQGCSLFMRILNLPPGDSPPGVQSVYVVSKPASRGLSVSCAARLCVFWTNSSGLSARGAAYLSGYWTYLQGTVRQGCSLFMRFLNLPPGDCRPGLQSVYVVSKPTSRGLSARGAARLCGFWTYLQGTVRQGCSLFMQFLNLPPVDCPPGVLPVYLVTEPTSRGLSARGAVCLCGFWTYLQGTVARVEVCLCGF